MQDSIQKRTKYDRLIDMLDFVNESENPVEKKELQYFGFCDNEITEFCSRIYGSDSVHINSLPLLVKAKKSSDTYWLTGEGYRILQDHWHIQAVKESTSRMHFLTVVGIILSIVMICLMLISQKESILKIIEYIRLQLL